MPINLPTWKFISASLSTNSAVVLLYVLESSGSSPGRQGFFMAVNEAGEMSGSIGGGMMEHKFVEMAKEKLRVASGELREGKIKKQVHDAEAGKNRSGMICSGEQTVWIYELPISSIKSIKKIIGSLERNGEGSLILSPSGIRFENEIPEKNFHYEFRSEEDWIYIERTGYQNHVFIIGGGHCALAFSRIMNQLDFYVHIFEERAELNTLIANKFAHEKNQVQSYDDLRSLITAGDNHYVVIMSFGYRTDDKALRALVGKKFKYLGLLGSRKKIEKMFADYRKEGISEAFLNSIHAPVGLSIKSQTPEEIAISIAAEIIQIKNQSMDHRP